VTNCTAALPLEASPTYLWLHTENAHYSQFWFKNMQVKIL